MTDFDNNSSENEITIPVPWGTIAAKTWNDPKGSPVLLVHGLMDNAGGFDDLIPLLPESYYFVAIDYPGHGKSTFLPPGVTVKAQDLLLAIDYVVDYLGWDQFILIGHSIGGDIGYYYSALFPNKVKKLLTIDGPAFLFTPETLATHFLTVYRQLKQNTSKPKQDPIPYDAAVRHILALHPSPMTAKAARSLAKRCLIKSQGGYVFTLDPRTKNGELTRFSAEQCIAVLKDLKCPVMQIAATDSGDYIKNSWKRFEPVKDFLRNKLKGCYRFEIVEGGHCVHMDYPERVSGLVNEFLQDLEG